MRRRDLEWAKYHTDDNSKELTRVKLQNYRLAKVFCDALDRHVGSNNVFYYKDLFFLSISTKNCLVYDSGLPNFQHYLLTPNGYYINKFHNFDLWKRFDIDSTMLSFFKSLDNTKYKQPNNKIKIDKPYVFYALQNTANEKQQQIKSTLKWATKNKRLVVFKPHPIHYKEALEFWEKLKGANLISDYTQLVSDVDVNDLIINSTAVVTNDSSTTFTAALYGIPSATFSRTRFCEIVPHISDISEIDGVTATKEKDVERFLTWYYNKLVVDVTTPQFESKIQTIIDLFFYQNQPFEYIFSDKSQL